jgi:hypothetical protein
MEGAGYLQTDNTFCAYFLKTGFRFVKRSGGSAYYNLFW